MIVRLDIKLHHTCWTGKYSTVLDAYLSITLHNTTRYDYKVFNSVTLLYLDRAVNHSDVQSCGGSPHSQSCLARLSLQHFPLKNSRYNPGCREWYQLPGQGHQVGRKFPKHYCTIKHYFIYHSTRNPHSTSQLNFPRISFTASSKHYVLRNHH